MLKYRGQYRVLYEIDKAGKPCEFSFIPCRIKKGASIVRHNVDTLNVYIPGAKAVNKLLKEYPYIFKPFQIGSAEGTFLFPESLLLEAAEVLRPYVKGKNMSPKPKRKVTISEERKKELSERMKRLHADTKNIGGNARKTV